MDSPRTLHSQAIAGRTEPSTRSADAQMKTLLTFVKAMQEKDLPQLDAEEAALFAGDFVYLVGGNSRISGRYEGWREFRRVLEHEVSTPAQMLDIAVGTRSVFALVHLRGERIGRVLDQDVFYHFGFDDEARLRSARSVPVDAAAWDAFWA